MTSIKTALVFCALLGVSGTRAADNWTEFRGPSGSGHSDATGLPREWSETWPRASSGEAESSE